MGVFNRWRDIFSNRYNSWDISLVPMIRDDKHLKFIRSLPCCVCLKTFTVQAAHIRKGNDGGAGLKPSDCYTVPLCYECHIKQHTMGEVSFWGDIDKATQLASKLYILTDKSKAILTILEFNRVFRSQKRQG